MGRIIPQAFFRFCLVGIVNTIHHYLWYLPFCLWLSYEAANTIAFLAAMVGSFYLNNYLTFRTIPSLRKFVLFPLTYIPQLAAAYLVPFVLIPHFHVNPYIVPIITTLTVLPLTYFLMGFLLGDFQIKTRGEL